MKTRTLLIAAFGLVLVIVVLRSAWSYLAFDRALESHEALVLEDDGLSNAIDRASALAVDMETGIRGWQITEDLTFLEPYERATRERQSVFDELGRVSLPDVQPLVADFRKRVDAWRNETARPVAGKRAAEVTVDRVALMRHGKQQMDDIRATVDQLHQVLNQRRHAEAAAFAAYRQSLFRETWASGLALAAILIAIAITLLRSIERPFAALVEHADRTAGGDFAPVEVGAAVVEVKTLATALSRMSERLGAERDRERQFTALVTALSAGGDVATLANAALRALVREQGAVGGVMWVAREPGDGLTLAASIAVDPSKLPKEGGTMARDARKGGEPLLLDQRAIDATHIVRSALIDVTPRSLLVAPIRAANEIVGVVELAGTLRKGALDELERALPRVGLALENALAAERVGALRERLAETNEDLQAQNEELKAQEEELRAQSEELVGQREELARSNDELGRASRLKSDFLSSMSHELRTPLNAVIGFADLLLGGIYDPLSTQQRQAVSDILAAGRQLLGLVNDILDLAKIEAGRLEIQVTSFDIGALAQETCSLLAVPAKVRGVRLDPTRASAPLQCMADSDRVRQVVLNLVMNAIKFSRSGGCVALSAARSGVRPNEMVRFEVVDEGIGISQSDGARLFQPFTQVDSQRSGGTGLGLSICKRLVEQMGGEIGFSSEPGKGSTFFFTLPFDASENGAAANERPSLGALPAGGASIVVVEDDPAAAKITEGVLVPAGYRVRVCETGEAALDALRADVADLLIVDLGLPDMSGFALIDRVRADERTRAIPIVVLTARALSVQERATLEATADLVAQKGMMTGGGFLDSIETLLHRPRRAVSATNEAAAHGRAANGDNGNGAGHASREGGHDGDTASNGTSSERAPNRRERARVLIIDDNEINRRVLRAMLKSADYEVFEAADATDGLAIAAEQLPKIVLMDIRLPGLDGLEATRRLRADPKTRDLIVIAVSAQAMVGDRERALAAGCRSYLSKPVGRQELLDAVASALACGEAPQKRLSAEIATADVAERSSAKGG